MVCLVKDFVEAALPTTGYGEWRGVEYEARLGVYRGYGVVNGLWRGVRWRDDVAGF